MRQGAVYWRCETCVQRRRVPERAKVCPCGAKRPKLPAWYVRWYERGRPRMESVGRYGTAMPAQARLGEIRKALAESRAIRRNLDTLTTLGSLGNWYVGLTDVQARRSYADIVLKLAQVRAVLGDDLRISDLDAGAIERLRRNSATQNRREGFTASPATINRELANLSAMLQRARRDGKIEGLSLPHLAKLDEPSQPKRIYTADELLAVFQAMGAPTLTPAAAMVVLGLCTGMREDEIVGLRRGEVHEDKGFIWLGSERIKEGRHAAGKAIPLVIEGVSGDAALWAIKAQPRALHTDRVFHAGPATGIMLYRAFVAALHKVGIEGGTFHSLRHTFIARMVDAGIPERKIMAITGHRTRKVFDGYGSDRTRDALSVMGGTMSQTWAFDPVARAYGREGLSAVVGGV